MDLFTTGCFVCQFAWDKSDIPHFHLLEDAAADWLMCCQRLTGSCVASGWLAHVLPAANELKVVNVMEWTRIMLGWKQRLHIVLMSRVAFKKPICLPVWILWGVSEVHTQEQSTSFIQPVNSKYLHQYQAKRKEALCKSYSVEISICVVYLGVTVTLLSCKWNKLTGALSQCLGS